MSYNADISDYAAKIIEAMTDRQRAYLEMLNSVAKLLDENRAVWEGNANCVSLEVELDAAIAGMRAALQAQNRGPQSLNKMAARKALEELVYPMAKGLKAYASVTSNDDLMAELKITPRSLAKSAELALIGTAKRVADRAKEHLASLSAYSITAATIVDVEAASTTFTALLGQPKAARKQGKENTQSLEDWRKQGVETCNSLDYLIPMFEKTAPDFVWHYHDRRKIRKPGHRKRALTVRISNAAGQPIAHAMLSIPGESLKRKSTEKGQIYIQHLPPGNHVLRIDAEGYAMKEVPVVIMERQRSVVEVVM